MDEGEEVSKKREELALEKYRQKVNERERKLAQNLERCSFSCCMALDHKLQIGQAFAILPLIIE